MRFPVKKSTTLLGVAALAASLGLTACGGDDGGGSDSDTVTIWSSVDPPVQDGLLRSPRSQGRRRGHHDRLAEGREHQPADHDQDPGQRHPRHRVDPAARRGQDMVSRGAAQPLDDVVDMGALEEHGPRHARRRHGRRRALRPARLGERQEPGVLQQEGLGEAGYPTEVGSIDDLNALTEQIKADGSTPWCMGIESDTATGWPATDWFEDLVASTAARTATTSGSPTRCQFDSDVVREAAAEFEELMFTEGNVLGGREAIASTNFGTAGNPMFDAEPGCWMYKQGSFITGLLPGGHPGRPRRQRRRVRLPARRGRRREPRPRWWRHGDAAQRHRERQDRAWQHWPSPTSATRPRRAAPSSRRTRRSTSRSTRTSSPGASPRWPTTSTAFLFDGSDQMPGEVGAGTFWKEMTAWISGQQDLDTTLTNIDASWPSS